MQILYSVLGFLFIILTYLSFEFLFSLNQISVLIGRFVWLTFSFLGLFFTFFLYKKNRFYSFLALFSFFFFFIRIPFYMVFLFGEDGVFSNIYLNAPQKPLLWLVGQYQGLKYYSLIHHPSIPFAYMSMVGSVAQWFMDFDSLTDMELAFFMRFIQSLNFWAAWVLLIWLVKSRFAHFFTQPILPVSIIVLANLPIAIHLTTTEIHMDQSFGILSAVVLLIALVSFEEDWKHRILLVLAAALFNFGKNEWSFCFLISLMAMVFFLFLFKRGNRKDFLGQGMLLLVGFLLGNAVSMVYDFENYISGLDLMVDTAYKTTFANYFPRIDIIPDRFIHLSHREFNNRDWMAAFGERLEHQVPLFVFLAVLILLFFKHRELFKRPLFLFLALLTVLLFAVFAMTTHSQSVRYFALAYILLSYIYLSHLDLFVGKIYSVAKVSLLLVFAIATLREVSLQINLRNRHDIVYFKSPNPDLKESFPGQPCIGFYPSGVFNRCFDYLVDWKGREEAIELAEKLQVKRCN